MSLIWMNASGLARTGLDILRRLPMSYRTFATGICFLALTLGAATWLIVPMTARPQVVIGRAAFAEIKIGMARENVETIIGGPPRDYTGGRFAAEHLA